MIGLLDALFPPRSDERLLRAVSLDAFIARALPRIASETRPGTVVLLPFDDEVIRAAIHEAKYHGSRRAFTLLGSALADYLHDADDFSTMKSDFVLVPIPLGAKRRKERGFNQVEEVAKRTLREFRKHAASKVFPRGAKRREVTPYELSRHFSLEPDLLIRTRETTSQVSLRRSAREKNMRGAFIATPKLKERRRVHPDTTFILLDDVLTTGATLQAAIDALTEAGAQHIIPIAFAH